MEMSERVKSIPILDIGDVVGVTPKPSFPTSIASALNINLPGSMVPSSTIHYGTRPKLMSWICLAVFLIDFLYLMSWWAGWFGRYAKDGGVGPSVTEKLLVLMLGLLSPVLLIQVGCCYLSLWVGHTAVIMHVQRS